MSKNFRTKINRNKREINSFRNARYNSYLRTIQQKTDQIQNAMNETISQKMITIEKNRNDNKNRNDAYRNDRDRNDIQNVNKNNRNEFIHDNSHVVC